MQCAIKKDNDGFPFFVITASEEKKLEVSFSYKKHCGFTTPYAQDGTDFWAWDFNTTSDCVDKEALLNDINERLANNFNFYGDHLLAACDNNLYLFENNGNVKCWDIQKLTYYCQDRSLVMNYNNGEGVLKYETGVRNFLDYLGAVQGEKQTDIETHPFNLQPNMERLAYIISLKYAE